MDFKGTAGLHHHTLKGLKMNKFDHACLKTWGFIRGKVLDVKGQGTTEYAILVGVLAVIAIAAITLFKPKIEELWNAIATGINGL